jgi:hypothetical protein
MVGDYGIGSPFVQTNGINGHDNNNQVQGHVHCFWISIPRYCHSPDSDFFFTGSSDSQKTKTDIEI